MTSAIKLLFLYSLFGQPSDLAEINKNLKKTKNISAILKQSLKNKKDPYLFLSIAMTESAFDEKAISSTGDIGLFQINCQTWYKLFGYKTKEKCFSEMKDPIKNTLSAMAIIEIHRNKYKQCRGKNIAHCYNGGPRWKESENKDKIVKYGNSIRRKYTLLKKKYPPRVLSLILNKERFICQ